MYQSTKISQHRDDAPRVNNALGLPAVAADLPGLPPLSLLLLVRQVVVPEIGFMDSKSRKTFTVRVDSLPHRKWKETKQQPSMLPDPAVPGCC